MSPSCGTLNTYSDYSKPMADAQPQSDLARLQKLSDEHLEGWKRAKADYLNLKKQTDKDRTEIAQFAQAAAVVRFLPIYDNLKRSAEHIPVDQQSQEWVKGLTHIQKQFEDVLHQMGIEPIPTVGHAFDPNRHHAVHKVKAEGAVSGSIVAELGSGFMIGDRVLEPAKVTVAE